MRSVAQLDCRAERPATPSYAGNASRGAAQPCARGGSTLHEGRLDQPGRLAQAAHFERAVGCQDDPPRVQVAVDQRDQPHWARFPDDPRLLGRSLEIGAAGIALDDDSRACTQPALSDLAPGTLQDFIGQRFPRPARFETPAAPTLHDFGLEMPDAAIAPVQVRCTPDASSWNGAWLVRLPSGRLLTNYDNSGYVLVLQRREPDAAIRASFACGKARSASNRRSAHRPRWPATTAASRRPIAARWAWPATTPAR